MMTSDAATSSQPSAPRWQPLPAIDRRVLGVLVEKAKTTPEAYPLSANAIRAGANQKNNRYPLMDLELEDIEESMARLRTLGAVAEVQAGGRVPRFRHFLYEWLGVEKVEAAVMTELLLRGTQTEGELRGRAARMEAIADVAALRPILSSLKAKGLVISLSPEGRGHVVTHALYLPEELEKQKSEVSSGRHAGATHDEERPARSLGDSVGRFSSASDESVEDLRRQLEAVRAEVADLREAVERLRRAIE